MRPLLAHVLLASVRLGTETAMGRFGRTPESKWYRFGIKLGIIWNTHSHMISAARLLLTGSCTQPIRINESRAHTKRVSQHTETISEHQKGANKQRHLALVQWGIGFGIRYRLPTKIIIVLLCTDTRGRDNACRSNRDGRTWRFTGVCQNLAKPNAKQ